MESKLFKNNMASTDRKNKNTHPYHNMAAIPPPPPPPPQLSEEYIFKNSNLFYVLND